MNKSLDIIMTRKQEKSFIDGISNDFGTVLNILKIIDAQKAKAFSEDDRKMIENAVVTTIGFDKVNETLIGQLRKWIAEIGMKRFVGLLFPGSREWLFDDISNWHYGVGNGTASASSDGTSQQLFVLEGGKGTGKSVITAELSRRSVMMASNDTTASTNSNKTVPILAQHYFKNVDLRTIDAKSAIQSISLQLSLIKGFALDSGITDDKINKMQLPEYFKYYICDPLNKSGNNCPNGMIIFDAMDECKQNKDLSNAILNSLEHLPKQIKIFVSTRPEIFDNDKLTNNENKCKLYKLDINDEKNKFNFPEIFDTETPFLFDNLLTRTPPSGLGARYKNESG